MPKTPIKKSPPTKNPPFAVTFRHACRDEGIGKDRGYQLCKSGEWTSYLDGGIRKVTVASIEARRARLIEATRGKFEPAPLRGQATTPEH